jgi:hypothetical protein
MSTSFTVTVVAHDSDGYTVDFYKFFWKDIGPFVFRSLFGLSYYFPQDSALHHIKGVCSHP